MAEKDGEKDERKGWEKKIGGKTRWGKKEWEKGWGKKAWGD